MTTTIEKSFSVDASIDKVWALLNEPDVLVACLPGASLTEKVDDANYKGEVNMKFGPVKASYTGLITFEDIDHDAKTMKMIGKGTDTKGKGGAGMVMEAKVSEKDGSTNVDYTIQIDVTGMMAQFGARLIGDVSNSIFDDFQKHFQAAIQGEEIDNSLKAGKMTGTVLKSIFRGKK